MENSQEEWLQLVNYMRHELGANYTNWYRFVKNPVRSRYAATLLADRLLKPEAYWLHCKPSTRDIWNNPLYVELYKTWRIDLNDLAERLGSEVSVWKLKNVFVNGKRNTLTYRILIHYCKKKLGIIDAHTLINANTPLYSELKLLKPRGYLGKPKLVSIHNPTRA